MFVGRTPDVAEPPLLGAADSAGRAGASTGVASATIAGSEAFGLQSEATLAEVAGTADPTVAAHRVGALDSDNRRQARRSIGIPLGVVDESKGRIRAENRRRIIRRK